MLTFQKAVVSVAVLVAGFLANSHTSAAISITNSAGTSISISIGSHSPQLRLEIPEPPPLLCTGAGGCPGCANCVCEDGQCFVTADKFPTGCTGENNCPGCADCVCHEGSCFIPTKQGVVLHVVAANQGNSLKSSSAVKADQTPDISDTPPQTSDTPPEIPVPKNPLLCNTTQDCLDQNPICHIVVGCVCHHGRCLIPAKKNPLACVDDQGCTWCGSGCVCDQGTCKITNNPVVPPVRDEL